MIRQALLLNNKTHISHSLKAINKHFISELAGKPSNSYFNKLAFIDFLKKVLDAEKTKSSRKGKDYRDYGYESLNMKYSKRLEADSGSVSSFDAKKHR